MVRYFVTTLALATTLLAVTAAVAFAFIAWLDAGQTPPEAFVDTLPDPAPGYARAVVADGFQVCTDLYGDHTAAELRAAYLDHGLRGHQLDPATLDAVIGSAARILCPEAPTPGLLPG